MRRLSVEVGLGERDSRIPIFREMGYFLVLKARKEGNEAKRKQGKERYNETSNKFK